MVNSIFNLVGSAQKEITFFENSHHAPMAHENERYQEKVIQFIEKIVD